MSVASGEICGEICGERRHVEPVCIRSEASKLLSLTEFLIQLKPIYAKNSNHRNGRHDSDRKERRGILAEPHRRRVRNRQARPFPQRRHTCKGRRPHTRFQPRAPYAEEARQRLFPVLAIRVRGCEGGDSAERHRPRGGSREDRHHHGHLDERSGGHSRHPGRDDPQRREQGQPSLRAQDTREHRCRTNRDRIWAEGPQHDRQHGMFVGRRRHQARHDAPADRRGRRHARGRCGKHNLPDGDPRP